MITSFWRWLTDTMSRRRLEVARSGGKRLVLFRPGVCHHLEILSQLLPQKPGNHGEYLIMTLIVAPTVKGGLAAVKYVSEGLPLSTELALGWHFTTIPPEGQVGIAWEGVLRCIDGELEERRRWRLDSSGPRQSRFIAGPLKKLPLYLEGCCMRKPLLYILFLYFILGHPCESLPGGLWKVGKGSLGESGRPQLLPLCLVFLLELELHGVLDPCISGCHKQGCLPNVHLLIEQGDWGELQASLFLGEIEPWWVCRSG